MRGISIEQYSPAGHLTADLGLANRVELVVVEIGGRRRSPRHHHRDAAHQGGGPIPRHLASDRADLAADEGHRGDLAQRSHVDSVGELLSANKQCEGNNLSS